MTPIVPLPATTWDDREESKAGTLEEPSHRSYWWADVLSILIGLGAAYLGRFFFLEWFSSVDHIVLSVCAFIGFAVALIRSNWNGPLRLRRLILAVVVWGLAIALLVLGMSISKPEWICVALGVAVAGWVMVRVRGERVQHAFSLGLVFVIPVLVNLVRGEGLFVWLEGVAAKLTSGLADAVGQSHIRDGNLIHFGHGIASEFSCVGRWDSMLAMLGIGVLCSLGFRRQLLPALCTILSSVFVWLAIRSISWVAMSYTVSHEGTWHWPIGLEIGLFLLGGLLIASLDQFWGVIFEPIPFEFIHTDFPLFAFAWNWLCVLPQLTVRVPEREMDLGSVEGDY